MIYKYNFHCTDSTIESNHCNMVEWPKFWLNYVINPDLTYQIIVSEEWTESNQW